MSLEDASSSVPSGPEVPPSPVLPPGLEPVRLLGRGKVALVHLAREAELGRLVAVKVLRPELARDEVTRQRFEREARSAASLSDPNVVGVHRFGRLDDGTPYLVMRYVTGRTLADRLAAAGPMSEDEGRRVLAQIASALAAAHRKGIVHRDLRPENVLLDEEGGRALLSDFGLAAVLDAGSGSDQRLTRTGQVLGEPRYASPEQLRGEPVTGQSDVYSLAVVGYEMLSGKGPYAADKPQQWIRAHLTGEPRPLSSLHPGVSRELELVLLRCLAREPAHRPRAEDLVTRLQGGAEAGRGPGAGEEFRRRRIPQLVAAAAMGGGTIVGLTDALIDNTDLPPWTFAQVLNLVVWVFVGSCLVAWFHGERGRQRVNRLEVTLLAIVALGWAATSAMLFLR